MLIRDYNEQVHANELDILKEMNKFLEAHSLPRLNYEVKENLNGSVMRKVIISVTKIPQQIKL